MPTMFLPPPGNPSGVPASPIGPMPMPAPGAAPSPISGISDGLTQALMLAKLRQGKLRVPSVPGQVPGATTQPGVQPINASTPGLPDQ